MTECGFRIDSGYKAAAELFSRDSAPDSLFCSTDNIAIGAMMYFREHNIRVPEQVQVAGTGDTELAHIIQPSLCTAHYYYKTSGEEAARLLLELFTRELAVKKEIQIGHQLIENDSIRR